MKHFSTNQLNEIRKAFARLNPLAEAKQLRLTMGSYFYGKAEDCVPFDTLGITLEEWKKDDDFLYIKHISSASKIAKTEFDAEYGHDNFYGWEGVLRAFQEAEQVINDYKA